MSYRVQLFYTGRYEDCGPYNCHEDAAEKEQESKWPSKRPKGARRAADGSFWELWRASPAHQSPAEFQPARKRERPEKEAAREGEPKQPEQDEEGGWSEGWGWEGQVAEAGASAVGRADQEVAGAAEEGHHGAEGEDECEQRLQLKWSVHMFRTIVCGL